jgi:hypothetical protein
LGTPVKFTNCHWLALHWIATKLTVAYTRKQPILTANIADQQYSKMKVGNGGAANSVPPG